MRWETRVHWLWGLFVPGRWYLLLVALGVMNVLAIRSWGLALAAITLLLLIIGGSGLLALRVHWHSFSLSFLQGDKALWERHGFEMIAERRINMSLVGTTEFQQTFLGRILDYGSLSIGALGGPYEWENLGHFRTLRRIIESQGEWMPPRRPLINNLTDWVHPVITLISQLLLDLLQILNSLELEGRTIIEHFRAPNYRRFLEFAEKILFSQNTHPYKNWNPKENLRSATFTDEETKKYQGILRMRRLIVSDFQGRTRRHKRVRTPKDIRRYIPVSWFRRAIRTV